jgi:hypothetical protein
MNAVKFSRAISLVYAELKTNVSETGSVSIIRVGVRRNDESTIKLTTGGVLSKLDTSSLARFDHSCLRNALLEMVKGALKLQRGVCLR